MIGSMDGYQVGHFDGWKGEQMLRWMDGWMGGWLNSEVDGQMK